MSIDKLNELANDIYVQRIEIDGLKQKKEKLLEEFHELQAVEALINSNTIIKGEKQKELIELMSSNQLKSWKTEQANFARSKRYSVSVDPNYKKQVEKKLKDGEEVEGFNLKETEFMSIRLSK